MQIMYINTSKMAQLQLYFSAVCIAMNRASHLLEG